MSFTEEELRGMTFSQLLKVSKFVGISTYRKRKEDIIQEIYDEINPKEVAVEEVQRSVRVQRIYEQNLEVEK